MRKMKISNDVNNNNQGDKERNYDFLNSIELLIMDQTEIFMMQNWEHILCLLGIILVLMIAG